MVQKQAAIAVIISLVIAARAQGQAGCSDPSLDRLKHPPGTKTAPLGELGRVDKVGKGPVSMILIPGAAFGGSIWKEFMKRNGDAYTMYAITPPGYEGTRPPPWPETADYTKRVWTKALCEAIVRLIEKEKLVKPIIVGHHMLGDHYALRIALDHPEKVGGVVVVAGMPSMAFSAYGKNKPGEPVKTATAEQRKMLVERMWAPFYKHVTEKMWKAGSYQARTFSRNKSLGKRLYKEQVAVPIPTQVQYFLEYMTTDLDGELEELAVPLLTVIPRQEWTLDSAMERFRESNVMMYGSVDKAKAAWATQMKLMWGDVDIGIRWMYDWGFRWERLKELVPDMTIRYVDDTEVFIMNDQPRALDQALRDFVSQQTASADGDGHKLRKSAIGADQ
jgi:pimeloyl-ACP methyl ester carboxylesterase